MVWWESILESAYAEAIYVVLGVTIIASVIDFILTWYGKRAQKKNQQIIGQICLAMHGPLYVLILMTGLFLGLKALVLPRTTDLWINKVFYVAGALITSYLLTRVSGVLVSSWLRVSRRYEKTPQLINKVIAIVIYTVAVLVILDYFQVEVTPIIATLGVGGIAIGLALQDTLKDFFAGLHIISDRPIKVGDFVEIEGSPDLKGAVEDIGWRSTRMKTLLNNYVIVPNSKLAASTIHNYSLPSREMALLVDVGVDYTSDMEQVEDVTVDVARKIQREVEGALQEFEPFIRIHTFGDNNIGFTVILRVKDYVDRFYVRNEFIKALHHRYKKEGIEISWPIRKVYEMGKPKSSKPKAMKKREAASKKGMDEWKKRKK